MRVGVVRVVRCRRGEAFIMGCIVGYVIIGQVGVFVLNWFISETWIWGDDFSETCKI